MPGSFSELKFPLRRPHLSHRFVAMGTGNGPDSLGRLLDWEISFLSTRLKFPPQLICLDVELELGYEFGPQV